MEGRILEIVAKAKVQKRQREEAEKAHNDAKVNEQIAHVVQLLESAESLPITIPTTLLSTEARAFLEDYFIFTAAFEPGDDHYHSLWKIDI